MEMAAAVKDILKCKEPGTIVLDSGSELQRLRSDMVVGGECCGV